MLGPFLKDPIVNVRIDNFTVTVMGEVRNPGSYSVKNERINIVEAIGLAGDLNIQAKRKSITLIREQNGNRVFIPIDITRKDIFNSPYFYLAQNDIVYVEPNKTKINSSGVGANTAIFISSLTLLVSVTAILLGR
jgi:polysaccharide export outer membrane protein